MSKQPDNDDAAIHLRVDRERKARWVAQSRAESKKLGDWIIERVEARDDQTKDAAQAPKPE